MKHRAALFAVPAATLLALASAAPAPPPTDNAQPPQRDSPIRAARFVQIEYRFGLVTDLTVASELPLIEAPAR
jgi:hypothetical protein